MGPTELKEFEGVWLATKRIVGVEVDVEVWKVAGLGLDVAVVIVAVGVAVIVTVVVFVDELESVGLRIGMVGVGELLIGVSVDVAVGI